MASQNRVPKTKTVSYLEFSFSNTGYPFVAVSTIADGEIRLEEFIPRGDAGYAEFFSVRGVDPDRVLSLADEHSGTDATLVDRFDDGGLFEFVVDDNCPAVYLGEQGALPRTVESRDGKGIVAAEVPASEDPLAIVEDFLDAHPSAELRTKCEQSYDTPIFSQRYLQQAVEKRLTARQREALELASEAGYYAWPREVSGEELADTLDIAPSTFHQHLRCAEQKLISLSLERR